MIPFNMQPLSQPAGYVDRSIFRVGPLDQYTYVR